MKRALMMLWLALVVGALALPLMSCQQGEQTGTVVLDENGEPEKNP
jgi:hypothetical protein